MPTTTIKRKAPAENGARNTLGACKRIDASQTPLDCRIKAEYQYTHTQQPKKHLDALIRFLVKQHRKCGQGAKGEQQ